MPTTLGKAYPVDWRGKPPHMLKTDIPVWWRFLEQEGGGFLNLYYDCLLGGPFLSPEDEKDNMKRMWRANLSKRADAIAETPDEVWIIEVASDPGLRSVGQIQVYLSLWMEDPKIAKPEKLVLVCERLDPDLGAAAARFGILIFVV